MARTGPEGNPQTFGQFVSGRLAATGRSQSELALDSDLSPSAVSKYIQDKIEPGAGAFIRMCRSLGVESLDEVEGLFRSPQERELDEGIATALSTLPEIYGAGYRRLHPSIADKRFALKLFQLAAEQAGYSQNNP